MSDTASTSAHRKWFIIRILAVVIALFIGPALGEPEGGVGLIDWIVVFVGTFLGGVMIGIFASLNPEIPKTPIRWTTSPFNFKAIHVQCHFFSVEIIAAGTSALLVAWLLKNGNEAAGLFYLLMGAGLRVGLFCGMFPFRNRFCIPPM